MKINNRKGLSRIVFVILALVVLVFITGVIVYINKNNNTEETSNLSSNTENTDTSKQGENSKDYWINTVKWGKKIDKFNSTLFYENLSLPINLNDLDDFCDEYNCTLGRINAVRIEANSFNELINNYNYGNYKIRGRNEEGVHGSIQMQLYTSRISKCYMDSLYFMNYSNDELTIKECYEKGWWNIGYHNHDFDSARVFGIEKPNDVSTADWQRSGIELDAIVEKLGAPSYVILGKEKTKDYGLNLGDFTSLGYELVYTYANYTITIKINDMFNGNMHIVTSEDVYYFNSECWKEQEKNVESLFINKENYGGVEYRYYDIDSWLSLP